MTEIVLSASVLLVAVLAAMSVAFARRVPPGVRLPMQWGLDGRPTWYAPRALALAVTPLLAAGAIGLVAIFGAVTDSQSPAWVMVVVDLAFLGAHGLHLALAGRWLRSHASAG